MRVFTKQSSRRQETNLWILLVCTILTGASGNMVQLEKSILEKVLVRYDARVRPHLAGSRDSPTKISVNIFVTDIFDVNDFKMEYTIQMYLRQSWIDPRLRYPDPEGIVKSIPLTLTSRIWTPDLFFNEREGKFHHIQKHNTFLEIYPLGKVSFRTRLSLKLRCPMNFKYFPFDKQICTFEIESYGFTTKDIELAWAYGSPLQVNQNLHVTNFILEDYKANSCEVVSGTGENGCLKVMLQLKRKYGFYLTQIFIPCVILVAVSWMSFWLDARAVTLRLSLLMILIFIMMMLTTAISSSLPTVSYAKAIDIWDAVCLSFVFGAILEFILVNQLARRESKMRNAENHSRENGGTFIRSGMKNSSTPGRLWKKYVSQHIPLSKRIDFACRIVFPLAFVTFNCLFWLCFVRGREDQWLPR